MKVPINCPICGDPMLNNFDPGIREGTLLIYKSCNKRITHNINLRIKDDLVSFVEIIISPNLYVRWTYSEHPKVLIGTRDKWQLILPFFEPDFSDYKKLVNKVKTYLLFS